MANKPFFNERDSQLIKKMLTGGVALGGSAGLAASLANYIKTLNSERASSADDDDVMYVTLPPEAQKTASLGGAVALTAGGLGTLGSYAAVRKIYQAMKKKRYQEMLDSAQQGYVDTLDEEQQSKKEAADGKPMGFMELLTSIPWAAPLVLGLGSGVVTHKLLDDAYPTVKKDDINRSKPKRVVIRRRNTPPTAASGDEAELEEEGSDKGASFTLDYDLDDGAEFLLHMITSSEKSASVSELPDLIHAIASGRHAELESASLNGTELVFETVKGASENEVSLVTKELAHILAIKSAGLGHSVKLMAAAEYNNMAPGMMKLAASFPEHIQEALAGITCLYGAALRKEASADILKALQIENAGAPGEELLVDELRVPDLLEQAIGYSQSDMKGEVSEEAESGLSLEKRTEESSDTNAGAQAGTESEDMIDTLMTGGENQSQEVVVPEEEPAEETI